MCMRPVHDFVRSVCHTQLQKLLIFLPKIISKSRGKPALLPTGPRLISSDSGISAESVYIYTVCIAYNMNTIMQRRARDQCGTFQFPSVGALAIAECRECCAALQWL